MTPVELYEYASQTNPLTGETVTGVYLTLRRDRIPRGETVRLSGRVGPKGRIGAIQEAEGGGFAVVAFFNAAAVRDFAHRMIV